MCHDDSRGERYQLRGELGKAIQSALRISVLDENVRTLRVAERPKPLAECLGKALTARIARIVETEHAYAGNFLSLLRLECIDRKQQW